MKKTYILLIVSFLLVLGVGFGNIFLLNKGVSTLFGILEPIEECIYKEDWQKAQEIFHQYDQEWRKQRKLWQITIDHKETENIEVASSHLDAAIALNSVDDAILGLYELRHNIEHILYIEKLSWQNIL